MSIMPTAPEWPEHVVETVPSVGNTEYLIPWRFNTGNVAVGKSFWELIHSLSALFLRVLETCAMLAVALAHAPRRGSSFEKDGSMHSPPTASESDPGSKWFCQLKTEALRFPLRKWKVNLFPPSRFLRTPMGDTSIPDGRCPMRVQVPVCGPMGSAFVDEAMANLKLTWQYWKMSCEKDKRLRNHDKHSKLLSELQSVVWSPKQMPS